MTYLARFYTHGLDTQSQHPRSPPRVVPVRFVIPGGYSLVHALQSLRGTLDRCNPLAALRVLDGRERRHALQGGRELVAALDVDAVLVRGFLGYGGNEITWMSALCQRKEE